MAMDLKLLLFLSCCFLFVALFKAVVWALIFMARLRFLPRVCTAIILFII